jgi:hypothetical protein
MARPVAPRIAFEACIDAYLSLFVSEIGQTKVAHRRSRWKANERRNLLTRGRAEIGKACGKFFSFLFCLSGSENLKQFHRYAAGGRFSPRTGIEKAAGPQTEAAGHNTFFYRYRSENDPSFLAGQMGLAGEQGWNDRLNLSYEIRLIRSLKTPSSCPSPAGRGLG